MKTLRELLFEAWINGMGQDKAQRMHDLGESEYGHRFEDHINKLSNIELIDLLDQVRPE